MAETAQQRAKREADEATKAAQGDDTPSGDDTPAAAPEAPQEAPEAPTVDDEPTPAQAREKAGRELASAEARYYSGQATLAELNAARSAWKATRRG